MEKKYFFIVNPQANSGKAKSFWLQYILPKITERKHFFKWIWSEKKGHIENIVCSLHTQYDVLVAVGGDGTLNEVVNGLMQNTQNITKTIKLGILPIGSGCDFARALGITRDISNALDIIFQGSSLKCDVGIIDFYHSKKYFLNIAGCAQSTDAVMSINTSKKYLGRKLSFLYGTFMALLKNKNYFVEVKYDDEDYQKINLASLFLCNAKYYGNGMPLGFDANPCDGLLFANQIEKMNLWKSLFLARHLYSENILKLAPYIKVRSAKKVCIRPADFKKNPIYVDCDGEYIGKLPAEFSISHQKLQIIYSRTSLH